MVRYDNSISEVIETANEIYLHEKELLIEIMRSLERVLN